MKKKFLEDRELISLYKNKSDNNSARIIMERYRIRLYNYILRKTGNEKDAEDIYQTVWLKIFKNIKGYKEQNKFSNYLFFVATNTVYDYYRISSKNKENLIDSENEKKEQMLNNIKSNDHNPESELIRKEKNKKLEKVITTLPDKQKEVILLRSEGFTFKEISKITSSSINSVLSRMRYAVDKLKNELGENYGM